MMRHSLAPEKRSSIIPAPFSFARSEIFEGNDGKWSTFVIRVGTPHQDFRVLISTAGQETWIPVTDGCLPTDPSSCGDLRGAQVFESQPSSGFQVNASSTWTPVNLYQLGLEQNLNYTGNGEYGLDTIALGVPNSGGLTAQKQVIAGVATKDFMFGLLGLGQSPSNLTNSDEAIPSLMWTLKNQSMIPSMSYGYTAGAYYRGQTGSLASLTLGGYDAARFTTNNLTFQFPQSPRTLSVGLQAIEVTDSLQDTMSLLPKGIFTLIDSTIPDIWLPTPACTIFEAAFGLQYDPTRDRYLVNDTIHTQLLKLNPTLTFILGNDASYKETTKITLPYVAFDLQASWPIYPNATNYFPLRRAANNTQYTLGRVFLQEAYIIVDEERRHFSVSQTVSEPEPEAHIITIPPFTALSTSHRLSRSAFAGILVAGIIVGVSLVFVGYLIYRRVKRSKRPEMSGPDMERNSMEKGPIDQGGIPAEVCGVAETGGIPVCEAEAPKDICEMDAGYLGHELQGRDRGGPSSDTSWSGTQSPVSPLSPESRRLTPISEPSK